MLIVMNVMICLTFLPATVVPVIVVVDAAAAFGVPAAAAALAIRHLFVHIHLSKGTTPRGTHVDNHTDARTH